MDDELQTTNALLEAWPALTPEERLEAFERIPRAESDDFFLELQPRDQAALILALPVRERRIWMRLLAPDDATDVIQEVPEEDRASFMAMLDDTARREVTALMAYQEDDAGGLMSPRFARLRPEMTIDEAIAYVRRQAQSGLVETVHYSYVLDFEQRLLGVVTFRRLFSGQRGQIVRDIMRSELTKASEDMDQEQLAQLFSEKHLLAIPIVDETGHMKGIVTADDIVNVVEEEASEDIQKIGGTEALDGPYLEVGFLQMVRKRGGWLAALFLGEMLTATAMGHFEKEIAAATVLALFIPLIISSGGNSGSQATTLVIRAMALGEVRLKDWWRVVHREFASGLTLGLILGGIGYIRILLWQTLGWYDYGVHFQIVALTVACSLVGVVLFGTLAGSTLPFILRLLGQDPASASAPFVATLVDVTGLIIYFTVASVILAGTLLK
jgi:magnesium transporter